MKKDFRETDEHRRLAFPRRSEPCELSPGACRDFPIRKSAAAARTRPENIPPAWLLPGRFRRGLIRIETRPYVRRVSGEPSRRHRSTAERAANEPAFAPTEGRYRTRE